MRLSGVPDDRRGMNRLLTGQIRPEDYVVDPGLVAEAMIEQLLGRCPSAMLVAVDVHHGESGGADEREAFARLDHA